AARCSHPKRARPRRTAGPPARRPVALCGGGLPGGRGGRGAVPAPGGGDLAGGPGRPRVPERAAPSTGLLRDCGTRAATFAPEGGGIAGGAGAGGSQVTEFGDRVAFLARRGRRAGPAVRPGRCGGSFAGRGTIRSGAGSLSASRSPRSASKRKVSTHFREGTPGPIEGKCRD